MDQSQATLAIDISLDDGFNGMQTVLAQIRPSWSWENIKRKDFTAGITNKICGFYLSTDAKWSDMVLVRLYGVNTELIIDRKVEQLTMKILHSHGSGPPMYAVLNNALVYGFVQGVTTDEKTIRDPTIHKLVAKEMAKLHSLDISKYPEISSSTPLLFSKIENFFSSLPQTFTDPEKQKKWEGFGKSISDMREEAAKMKELLLKHAKSPCGFTHNDLLLENLIFNSEVPKVSFIDYEYAGYNYLYFDIGNHFAEHAGVVEPDHSLYPERSHQREWLTLYTQEMKRLSGDNSQNALSEKALDQMCDEVNMFSLWSHLFWGVWALVQAENSLIPFDYVMYSRSRLTAYFNRKDEFLAYISVD